VRLDTGWRGYTITAADLQHKTFPAVAQVVPGLIVEGLSILAGKPKVGKSWAALDKHALSEKPLMDESQVQSALTLLNKLLPDLTVAQLITDDADSPLAITESD
jgi:hypothetical protein